MASLVNGCGLYAKSTALCNSLCAFTNDGGIVNGSYKSANELFGNSNLAFNNFYAAVSIAFICVLGKTKSAKCAVRKNKKYGRVGKDCRLTRCPFVI
ncbi:MAG: hypothetical protein H7296_02210 [Bacteroidia bacterium]|nr:hypothetical protein [Bacteroidia bacterium]